jgi:hypothetical protein
MQKPAFIKSQFFVMQIPYLLHDMQIRMGEMLFVCYNVRESLAELRFIVPN